MTGAGERAYAYAKACGVVGKSFLGAARGRLASVNRPAELDRLIFPDAPLDLPEQQLSARLERRIADRAASRIVGIVSSFSHPAAALVRLVRSYEYADLKAALASLAAGERKPPLHVDLGPFGTVAWDAYPNLKAMLASTEFDWLRETPTEATVMDAQTSLDLHFYRSLWREILELPKGDRRGFEELVAEEIELKNVVWALRLRSYYGQSGEEIEPKLADIARRGRSLAAEARRALTFAADRREDWRGWKFEALLNPESPGEFWKLDPRYVQNAAARNLSRRSRLLFHRRPFASDSIACFIKLMQYEEDLLTSVAEGLTLGLGAKETLALLEVNA